MINLVTRLLGGLALFAAFTAGVQSARLQKSMLITGATTGIGRDLANM